jgi:hypothetical protein
MQVELHNISNIALPYGGIASHTRLEIGACPAPSKLNSWVGLVSFRNVQNTMSLALGSHQMVKVAIAGGSGSMKRP